MSLYDEASLIITPNAYKENKLYALKPTDGSGDLTWTRASTKTRVNSEGLVESLPYNLALYSEQFNNAAWAKEAFGGSFTPIVTPNTTIAPDNNLTADTVFLDINTSGNCFVRQLLSEVSGTTYTFSVWLKGNGVNKIGLSGSNLLKATITPTTQWERYTITWTASSTSAKRFGLYLQSSIASSTTVFVWGAQLEVGTTAKPYFPTTDRLDIPSIDFTGGGCPSILVEPQRTNLLLMSNDVSNNTYWPKLITGTASTPIITPNLGISPRGIQEASLVELNLNGGISSANRAAYRQPAISVVVGNNYQCSFWLKAYQSSDIGKIISVAIENTTNTPVNITLTANWKRHTINTTANSAFLNFLFQIRGSIGVADNVKYYHWNNQLEQGSYPTSDISTVATTVTRVADTASKTGISNLIGQTEGVLYIEAKASTNQGYGRVISLSDGTNANKISLEYYFSDPNLIVTRIVSSNVQQAFMATPSTYPQNINHKIAIKYKLNDCSLFIDGIKVSFDTSALLPIGMSNLFFSDGNGASSRFEGAIKHLELYKTALTDAQLIQLTTL
jgi:hypothetical protein